MRADSLCAWLTDVELRANSPYRRDAINGEVGCEHLGGLLLQRISLARVARYADYARKRLSASDDDHEHVRSDQRNGGPRAHRSTDQSMTQAVRDVRREGRGNETSREASLTVRRHKVARVLVGDDRRDTDHGPGSEPPNQPIRRAHHAPTTLSVNSVVRAMGVVYVSCESPLGHSSFRSLTCEYFHLSDPWRRCRRWFGLIWGSMRRRPCGRRGV